MSVTSQWHCLLKFPDASAETPTNSHAAVIDYRKHFPDDAVFIAQIKVCRMADFFRLDKLRDLVIKSCEGHAKYLVKVFCESDGSAELARLWNSIEFLYDCDDIKLLKDVFEQTFVGLVIASSRQSFQNKQFKDLLERRPEFNSTLALGLLRGLGATQAPKKKDWRKDHVGNSCKKHVKYKRTMDIFAWIRHGVFVWQCEGCVPVPSSQALEDAKSGKSVWTS